MVVLKVCEIGILYFVFIFGTMHNAHAEFSQQSQSEGVYDIYMKRDVFSH